LSATDEIRAQAFNLQLKVQALDLLKEAMPNMDYGHEPTKCEYDNGDYYGPCTCGFSDRLRLYRFIEEAIAKA